MLSLFMKNQSEFINVMHKEQYEIAQNEFINVVSSYFPKIRHKLLNVMHKEQYENSNESSNKVILGFHPLLDKEELTCLTSFPPMLTPASTIKGWPSNT